MINCQNAILWNQKAQIMAHLFCDFRWLPLSHSTNQYTGMLAEQLKLI